MTTRREIVKAGAGLAAIIASGKAPASLVRSMLGIRNAMTAPKRLPYDAEVEYLESTGTQWIDTGIAPGNRKIDAEVTLSVPDQFFSSTIVVNNIFFGAGRGDTWSNGMHIGIRRKKVNDVFDYYWAVLCPGVAYNDGSVVSRTGFPITLSLSVTVSGTAKLTSSAAGFSTITKSYSYEFGANRSWRNVPFRLFISTTNDNPGPSNPLWPSSIHGMKISLDETLVRDFQPVRFTNDLGQTEGAMYDRANPAVGMNPDGSARTDGLYRNRGTGAFLYGNDI